MDGSGSSPDPHNVAARFQAVLLASERVEDFLAEVARSAAAAVPGALACGITVRARPGSRMLGATSDRFADRMDAVQYDTDDGPCLTCVRTGAVVSVDDIATDSRWPAFSRRGLEEDAGASMSVPMTAGGHAVGAVNLYTRQPGALSPADRDRALRFADQAAGAVALAIRLGEAEYTARHLATALQSRSTIDQAIGVLIGQAHVTSSEAFELLRLRSQHTNSKLRDVAAAVLAHAIGDSGDNVEI